MVEFVYEGQWTSWLHVSMDGRQGNVRATMEDAAVLSTFIAQKSRFHLFAILDGHAGLVAADFSARQLTRTLQECLQTIPNVAKAISSAFVMIDERLKTLKIKHDSGTTLSLILFREYPFQVWSANVGDSTIMGIDLAGKLKRLSVDHNTDRKHELDRMLKNNLKICDDYVCTEQGQGLAMTRSIGDHGFGPAVQSTPSIHRLNEKIQTVVQATDGFWDVVPTTATGKWINNASIMNNERHKRFAQHDNTTIMVLKWKPPPVGDPPLGDPVPESDLIERERIFVASFPIKKK